MSHRKRKRYPWAHMRRDDRLILSEGVVFAETTMSSGETAVVLPDSKPGYAGNAWRFVSPKLIRSDAVLCLMPPRLVKGADVYLNGVCQCEGQDYSINRLGEVKWLVDSGSAQPIWKFDVIEVMGWDGGTR